MCHTIAQLTVLLPILLGQETQDPPPAQPQPPPDQAQTPPHDDELFKDLGRTFEILQQSLSALGGISDESREVVRSLRLRFTEYNAVNPNHDRGIAHELQLAIWLGEDDLVNSLFPKLMELVEDDQPMRRSWSDYYLRANNYERLIALLSGTPADPTDDPEAVLTLSRCFFAQHRFGEALDMLESIPVEATAQNTALTARIDRLRDNCESYAELWPFEQVIRSTEEAVDDLPRVELVTARGRIVVELFENEAPNTVANFISLVEAGFYDGTKFHRVVQNFIAQGGDPNTKPGATGIPGRGGPGHRIPDEHTREGARNHFAGSLAMAKTRLPHTAGSGFFLTHEPTPHLNGQYTVFGRILEGLDVARGLKINDELVSAAVLRKRDHDYSPDSLPELETDPPGAFGRLLPPQLSPLPPPPPR
ncbi:MAG: peptidylprolyl isomerase [Phycisphaerales bacterium]